MLQGLLNLVVHEPLPLGVLFGFKLGLEQLGDGYWRQCSLDAVCWETRSQ